MRHGNRDTENHDANEWPHHILSEIGWNVRQRGEEMHGQGVVIPELHIPGRSQLRTSVLAAWSDQLMGLAASIIVAPRVPATLELEVHLYRPAPGAGLIFGRARLLKAGRSVLFARVEFRSEDGDVFAEGSGLFMLAGDPHARLPATLSVDLPARPVRLTVPIAQRAGCERKAPGIAVLPRTDDALNSANSVHGGLLAMAAEEAVLSLDPDAALCSLGLRYLRPVRSGPAVAKAQLRAGLAMVEVFDGNEDRLAVAATARTVAT